MAEPVWEVRWIPLPEGESHERVNELLATIAAGWEPFAVMPNRTEGWVLLLKLLVTTERRLHGEDPHPTKGKATS